MTHDLVRSHDWSTTALGPRVDWPLSLRQYVDMVLAMPTPAIIFWGPDQTQIYNDAYAVIMGPRHPRYFGAPYRESWPDTFPVIFPHMLDVLERGQSWQVARALFPVTRHGFDEEAYFTFSFSPLRDDSGAIAGIFQPVVEVTDIVLGERRAETLRALTGRAASIRERIAAATRALEANPMDLPFVRVYLWSETEQQLRPVLTTGSRDGDGDGDVPARVLLAHDAREPAVVAATDLGDLATGGDPSHRAYLLPVAVADTRGVAVFGLSPRLHFDDGYRAFVEEIGHELVTSLAAEQTRQALSESQGRLHRMAEASGIGSWELECAGGWLRGDDRLLQLFGLFPGRHRWSDLAERIHPDDRPAVDAALAAAVADEPKDDYRIEYRIQVGASERWVEGRGHVVRDDGGKALRVIGISVDITDRKLAEVERSRLLANEQTARAEAESASRAKDEFLAMLGHELRNPLAPILTALELMRLHGDSTTVRERTVIERQTEHLVRLVDDLLDVSRIREGKLELRRVPVELATVVATAIETASPLLEDRAHQLVVEVPVDGLELHADPARLAQAVSNLLTNAAKYTERGGRIEITARVVDGTVVLAVRDTGIGIEPDMLPRVFDLFAQEQQSLDRAQGGLGLGLAIVRSVVALHGGSAEAHSEGRHRGTEVVLRLPRGVPDAAAAAPVAAASHPASDPVAAPRILVVDDNEDAAFLLAAGLGAMGYIAEVAHDGPDALVVAARFRPDIAILDIGLPVMDGYELARRLRASGERIRLIALTGYGQTTDRNHSAAAGFDLHLVKPIGLAQIRAALDQLVVPS